MRWLAIFGSCRWQWFQRQLARFGMPAALAKSQSVPLHSHGYSEHFCVFLWGCDMLYYFEHGVFLSLFFIFPYIMWHPEINPVLQDAAKHTTIQCTFSGGGQKFNCFLSKAQAQHWLIHQALKACGAKTWKPVFVFALDICSRSMIYGSELKHESDWQWN